LRELLRRRYRRADRAGDVSYEIVEQGDRLGRGIEVYESVYERSWKPAEPFPKFNAGLMQEAARLGALRLGVCWHNEKPIAVQLWIVAHGRATVMKLAHDEVDGSLSPGTLLTASVIKRLIAEGVSEIDFGRGDDPYKRLWAGQRRQRIGLMLINPWRLGGLSALARHDVGRRIRGLQHRLAAKIWQPG
jgi:CelD/BcsL family acetyltransferase involved in cellulose biosynthesis